jgi:Trypsin-co-occurring domain 1
MTEESWTTAGSTSLAIVTKRSPGRTGQYVTDVVRFNTPTGEVLVEIDPVQERGPLRATKTGDRIHDAEREFSNALQTLAPAIEDIVDTVQAASIKVRTITVEFGVKLGVETSAIIAKGTAEANFKITVIWERDSGT